MNGEDYFFMTIRRIVIVGTMACFITLGSGISGQTAAAAKALALIPAKQVDQNKSNSKQKNSDPLIDAVGIANNENCTDALYEALAAGNSLADITISNQKDVDSVISLQVSQLQEQLDKRLADGHISIEAYQQQSQELVAIISESVSKKYHIF
jgi:hypothetical protein